MGSIKWDEVVTGSIPVFQSFKQTCYNKDEMNEDGDIQTTLNKYQSEIYKLYRLRAHYNDLVNLITMKIERIEAKMNKIQGE